MMVKGQGKAISWSRIHSLGPGSSGSIELLFSWNRWHIFCNGSRDGSHGYMKRVVLLAACIDCTLATRLALTLAQLAVPTASNEDYSRANVASLSSVCLCVQQIHLPHFPRIKKVLIHLPRCPLAPLYLKQLVLGF